MSVLSERLRELRGVQSQSEMAEALGMKYQQWARYENGEVAPGADILARICCVHACSADWLLGLRASASLREITTGNNSAVAIGANARASVRGTSAAPPGTMAACKKCPYKAAIEAAAKKMKGAR